MNMKESETQQPKQNKSYSTPALLTMSEASKALRISKWSLNALVQRRRLSTIRIGRRRLVPATSIEALIETLRSEESQ
jgi:excisionase family DNA binding protein